jgi:hypothetical protein
MNKVCTTTCIVSFVWVTPAFTWLNRSSILLSKELKQAPIFWSKELKQVSTFSARSICTNKLRVCTLRPNKLSDFHWVLQYKWLSWQCTQLTSLTWLSDPQEECLLMPYESNTCVYWEQTETHYLLPHLLWAMLHILVIWAQVHYAGPSPTPSKQRRCNDTFCTPWFLLTYLLPNQHVVHLCS